MNDNNINFDKSLDEIYKYKYSFAGIFRVLTLVGLIDIEEYGYLLEAKPPKYVKDRILGSIVVKHASNAQGNT